MSKQNRLVWIKDEDVGELYQLEIEYYQVERFYYRRFRKLVDCIKLVFDSQPQQYQPFWKRRWGKIAFNQRNVVKVPTNLLVEN